MVQRATTNTPLQALLLLNDPVFVEMAANLAKRVTAATEGSDRERIGLAFRHCLARNPDQQEIRLLEKHLQRRRRTATESEAWRDLCSVLMNLHEFITRD